MKEDNKNVGAFGENAACTYLKRHGYKIIERNYTNKLGEIDIIAQKGGYLVFVEVKTRLSDKFGAPADAVNFVKQQKIMKTAEFYVAYDESGLDYRFDVVEVMYQKSVFGGYKTSKVNHIENAF